jgi:hypothetical protein
MAHLNNEAIREAYKSYGSLDATWKQFRGNGASLDYIKKVCVPPAVKKKTGK